MVDNPVAVFFYGLFMDKSVLAAKGIVPSSAAVGTVDGYRLRIGKRATLVPEPGGRVHGVVMTIGEDEAADLYSDESVADYVPEPVSVRLPGGVVTSAICYNLPPGDLGKVNAAYADALVRLATTLGFPQDYLDQIRAKGKST